MTRGYAGGGWGQASARATRQGFALWRWRWHARGGPGAGRDPHLQPFRYFALAAVLLAVPALADDPPPQPGDPCRALANDKLWAQAAACLAQRPAQSTTPCATNDMELRARVFEQDGRFEAAAAAWQKCALACQDEAQLVRTRRSNALAQVELAIDLLLANKRGAAAPALQSARRDFELQQDALRAAVPEPLKFLQNLAATGKGAVVRRLGGDVPETVVAITRSADGSLWMLSRADYGPVGGKVRLRRLDASARDRRTLTVGNTGDDVPLAFDVAPDGQLAVIGTTLGRDKVQAAWLCRPSPGSGPAPFSPLRDLAQPRLVAQLPGVYFVAGQTTGDKPVLVHLDATGKEVSRTEIAVKAFVRDKKLLLAVQDDKHALVLTAAGLGKPRKPPKATPTPPAAELATPAGIWRATVEKVDDVGVVVLALLK